jgi:hypothetical protein
MAISKWTAIPANYNDVEKNVNDLNTAAGKTTDSGAKDAAKKVVAKFTSYKQTWEKGKNAESKKKADKDVGPTLMSLYNSAVEAVNKAAEEAASGGKPKYTVKGSLPKATSMEGADAAVTKATAVYNAMKSGKNPHEAASAAGISERPSIIENTKGKKWTYEFRLSHGGTQYRLNAVAESSDGGKNIAVEFKYLGRGH